MTTSAAGPDVTRRLGDTHGRNAARLDIAQGAGMPQFYTVLFVKSGHSSLTAEHTFSGRT
ncbi:hypothetical protein Ahu01nite_009560 [Winogradskya humida]|uniref:Uncharacterized protein n=1 Tax=Winogradskya humida TaxID=113566 RepID=A0ABQ3ZGZ1_9ACTN|nr:hypothetical protein Ahu01nite_009560 [Actinoplanes humidus]